MQTYTTMNIRISALLTLRASGYKVVQAAANLFIFTVGFALLGAYAHADVYRCTLAGGKAVYQDSPCNASIGGKEDKTDWTKARELKAVDEAKRNAEMSADRRRVIEAIEQKKKGADGRSLMCPELDDHAIANGFSYLHYLQEANRAAATRICPKFKQR